MSTRRAVSSFIVMRPWVIAVALMTACGPRPLAPASAPVRASTAAAASRLGGGDAQLDPARTAPGALGSAPKGEAAPAHPTDGCRSRGITVTPPDGLLPLQGDGEACRWRFGKRVVLVHFWSAWCEPCARMARQIEQWRARWQAAGLLVVGITAESPENAARVLLRESIASTECRDPADVAATRFDVRGYPTVLLFDREGALVARWTGSSPQTLESIETELSGCLGIDSPTW